jgi:iron complex outermembrane receptor protein
MAHREPTRANFKEAKGDAEATPRPERLYDIEIGYRYSSDFLTIGANVFNMNYKDQLIPTGEKSNVGYDIMTNVEKSYRRGIELEAVYLPYKFLRLSANMTLSSNKIKDYIEYATHYNNWDDNIGWYTEEEDVATPLGNTHIAYSPSFLWTSIIEYEFFPNARLSIISKIVGKQYFDNTSSEDRKINPYMVNDLRLEYELSYKFFKNISLMLQINNLFNNKYVNNAYGGNWYEDGEEKTWSYYYPQAGIHVFSGIKIRF